MGALVVKGLSVILIKKHFFTHLNKVVLQVLNFENLNFSKITVAYGASCDISCNQNTLGQC